MSSAINFSHVGNIGGANLTDWVSYTPTFTGFGTPSNVSFFWRRVGDSVHIMGQFTSGTTTATEARISLPNSITSDSTKIPSHVVQKSGTWYRDNAGAAATTIGGLTLIEGNVGYFTFGGAVYTQASGSVNPYTKVNGNTSINGTDNIEVDAIIPISGWIANGAGTSASTTIRSQVEVYDTPGFGATNTKILRFSNTLTNTGSDITYADSSTNGGSFTINTAGLYAVHFVGFAGSDQEFGISKNSSQLTTNYSSITAATQLNGGISKANYPTEFSWTGLLSANDVVRAHCSGSSSTGDNRIKFTITRIGN